MSDSRCTEAEMASGMSGRGGGGGDVVSGSSSSSESFLRHVGGACKGSAKSDRTLKHSDSLTWYDELRNWNPMNFLMSQKGGSMATSSQLWAVTNTNHGSRMPLLHRSLRALTVGVVGEMLEGN